ncbi:MAG: LLM class flavin-dependent oxidoreductase [Thaumarchaeota archaeon]|nr:LLM class flavin-dependent oxidoreductase [Nitrososphaerota archaeon]
MTTLQKLAFGISIEPNWSVNFSREVAVLSEKLGFDNVWVPDGGPMPPYSDPIVTLSAIASDTSRIKLGSSILNFYTRNPALLASAFMALSDLGTGGKKACPQRAILGIGIGSDYNVAKFGITERKGVVDELREAIESIRELFEGKEVTVRTDAFVIDDVSLSKSAKKIPIYVGAGSPKSLRLAGEIADGVILTDRIPSDIEQSVDPVILGIGYSSRKRSAVEIVDSVVISLDEDRQKAKRKATSTCAYLVAWMNDQKAEKHEIDLKTKKRISEFINRGDEASASRLVDRKMVDLLTASGNVEDCIEKCREYIKNDIDQLAFCEPFGPKVAESIENIAKKVIPKL